MPVTPVLVALTATNPPDVSLMARSSRDAGQLLAERISAECDIDCRVPSVIYIEGRKLRLYERLCQGRRKLRCMHIQYDRACTKKRLTDFNSVRITPETFKKAWPHIIRALEWNTPTRALIAADLLREFPADDIFSNMRAAFTRP